MRTLSSRRSWAKPWSRSWARPWARWWTDLDVTAGGIMDLLPRNTTLPWISYVTGNQIGDGLLASDGVWTNADTVVRQWVRNGVDIAGATNATYVLTAADIGVYLWVRETATNTHGSRSVMSNTLPASGFLGGEDGSFIFGTEDGTGGLATEA